MLVVGCFYLARKGKWLTVGMSGFFMSITRIPGVFVSIPLLYEYMKEKNFGLKKVGLDILALALVPFGFLLFCLYNYHLTGDFFAFIHIQSIRGHHFDNPLKTLLIGMFGVTASISGVVAAWLSGFIVAILVIFYRRIRFPYLLYCFFSLFIPLSAGLMSMPRYTVVLFPLFILLAELGKDKKVDIAFTMIFSVLQGCLMIFWSTGATLII